MVNARAVLVNFYIKLFIKENRQACAPVEDVIGGAHAV
jgi:hypothetical protein